MSYPKAGLLVGHGAVTPADLDVIRQARLEALKLRAIVNPASDLAIYRDLGIHTFLAQMLSPEPSERLTSPQEFVDYFAPAIEEYVRAGVRDIEVHGKPNRPDRGYGISWQSAPAFGEWFVRVAQVLKATFGPQLRAGFPGLSPPPPRQPGPAPAVSAAAFLSACADAVEEADFVCCHVYWDSVAGMREVDGGLRFIRQYLEPFPTKPLVISEFSNVDVNDSSVAKGDQYAELYFTCAQFDECRYDWPWYQAFWPRVQAAYAFILRSPDPAYASQVWADADGQPQPAVARVAARASLPKSTAMRFTWPTELHHYTQFYGENQQRYHEIASTLRGGHNGADLQVNVSDPGNSPIRACLSGTVTQKRMDEDGYGHHIRISSQVDDVGEVTLLYAHFGPVQVEVGHAVQAGDVLGAAGWSGNITGPHLHLGLKIEGLKLPANADYLNPRPYLDPPPPPRGAPRTPYARTYVLLPPAANATWAQAVVDAAWDSHRFTIGGSADDAGIGDLDFRRIVAVNPEAWQDDLHAFLEAHYPGVIYVPLEAEDADALAAALDSLPAMPAQPPVQPQPPRGKPRTPYDRTYVLMPPAADAAWAGAVIEGAWDAHRFTVGGSADDAGIGDLNFRRVIAVNPAGWGDDLLAFFDTYYRGILYVPVIVDTPRELAERLSEF